MTYRLMLQISSFVTGFSLMTLELVSVRLVAPIVGLSVITWTSVIGVTLLGLSIGSYVGGVIIDKKKEAKVLGMALLLSAFFVAMVIPFLSFVKSIVADSESIISSALSISFLLFLLPSLSLGMVQPMILKLYSRDFLTLGKEYGLLGALWSLGSIVGVFATGFYFVSYLGSILTIHIVSGVLSFFGIYYFLLPKLSLKRYIFLFSFILAAIFFIVLRVFFAEENLPESVVYADETEYYTVKIVDTKIANIYDARILFLDFDSHSIKYNNDAHPISYIDIVPVFRLLKNDIKSIHIIGGGAYIQPKLFSDYYKNAEITVTEIDPNLELIAETYFDLDTKVIKTIRTDARIHFRTSNNKYDLIFGDAYNSFVSVPWHLVTQEFTRDIFNSLNEDGIYALNMISSISGNNSGLFESVLVTIQSVFPETIVFAFGIAPESVQNIVIVGMRGNTLSYEELFNKIVTSEKTAVFAKNLVDPSSLEISERNILTDDFAPVERLMMPLIKTYYTFFSDFRFNILNNNG